MGLFGKKKKKREDEEDLNEEEEDEKPLKKKPEKSEPRKKKEKPKEWGRKERYTVLIIFLGTILLSGILALSSRNWKLPGFPRIKLPSFSSLNLFKEERIVIEGDKDIYERNSRITDEFEEITKSLSGIYGLYIVDLGTGSAFGVNENEYFEPASLNKLPIIIASYRLDELEELDLSKQYVLKEEDKISGSGILLNQKSGTIYTYFDLVNLMSSESDNTAYNVMRSLIGNENIENIIDTLGMNSTSILENKTTPRDIGVLLSNLYKTRFVSTDSTTQILDSLTDTAYESWLKKGVPKEVRVSHKYGREVNVVNDAGIVYAANPYVIVVMSKGVVASEADNAIPQISKMVFEEMSNYVY